MLSLDVTGHFFDLFGSQARAVALVLLDGEGKVVRWLAGAHDMFGYREPEVIGRHLDFLLPLHDQERGGWRRELQETLAHGERVDTRWLLHKDGTIVWMTLFNTTREEFAEIHAGLVAGLENVTLNPVIGKELPLDQAPQAHVAVMEPGAFGKIVLVP